MFIGYSAQSKGYKIWDLKLNEIIITRDLTFDGKDACSSESSAPKFYSLDIAFQGVEDCLNRNTNAEEQESADQDNVREQFNNQIESDDDPEEPNQENEESSTIKISSKIPLILLLKTSSLYEAKAASKRVLENC